MLNPGSYALILILIFGGYKYRNEYIIFIFKLLILTVYIEIGFFVKIGNFEMAYSEFLIIVLILYSVFRLDFKKIPKKILLTSLALVTIVFLGYLKLAFNIFPNYVLPIGGSWDRYAWGMEYLTRAELDSSYLLRLIRLVLFLYIYFLFDNYITSNIKINTNIKEITIKLAIFSSFVGIADQFSKIFLNSSFILDNANIFFGIGLNQLTWATERGSLPVLQGLMLEPGHYASSFIPAILILFLTDTFSNKMRFWCYLLFTYSIFFSGSLAGFAIIIFMTILYVSTNENKTIKIFIGSTLILLATLIFSQQNPELLEYYMVRINALVYGIDNGTSESIRSLSIKNALNLFKDQFFLGVGFGSSDFHGFLPSMLANFGFLGTLCWGIFMLKGATPSKLQNLKWLVALTPFMFFIGNVGTIYSIDMILIFALVFRYTEEKTN